MLFVDIPTFGERCAGQAGKLRTCFVQRRQKKTKSKNPCILWQGFLCLYDQAYKPGSVSNSNLSGPLVAEGFKPPGRGPPGKRYLLFAGLLRIGFTQPHGLPHAGELLPRLSILTVQKRRFFSVALSLESPPAAVSSYPCPMKPGLSSYAAFRRCARCCSACSQKNGNVIAAAAFRCHPH